jgi:2,5-furandicarboxylate decarboxylase 1
MQHDLRSFLDQLRTMGKLQCIEREIDPRFELAGVMQAVEKRGRASFFTKIKGSSFPVVNNILGSREMLAILFDTSPEGVVLEWVKRINMREIQPRLIPAGPVKEVVKKGDLADLRDLPILTHSSKDPGPYITAGIVVAKDPDSGIRNVSINRLQYRGKSELGIRMLRSQHLGQIYEKYEKRGKAMEIAVTIGNYPCELLAAATTLAYGVDEFTISSALRGEPLELVKCETTSLEVPATAEIVLEGEVPPGLRKPEGPFGDFMQFYNPIPADQSPVIHVRAITHRKDPIYQSIQAGHPEDMHLLALPREAHLYEVVSKVAEVRAVSLVPMIFSCAISIRKRFEGEPKNVAAAAFGAYSWLKYCIVVDHDVNVFDVNDVWWAMATRSDPRAGLLSVENARGFPRDPFRIHQSKLGIDATAPLNQWDHFQRKEIPGAASLRYEDYL